MYTTNLPDSVMIPDMLLVHIERGEMSDEARADARAWVGRGKSFGPDVRNYWRRQMQENVVACTRYHMHECVAIFSYVCEFIDELW